MASTLFANYKRVNKLIFFCVVVWFVAIGSLSYGFITDLDIMVIPPIIFGLGMGKYYHLGGSVIRLWSFSSSTLPRTLPQVVGLKS